MSASQQFQSFFRGYLVQSRTLRPLRCTEGSAEREASAHQLDDAPSLAAVSQSERKPSKPLRS